MFKLFSNLSRMFLFEADPGGGAGGDPPEDPPGGENADEEAKKKKAQEEENKKYADRAKRAAEAERAKILKDLGVTDPEEAKALLKKARDADEANKTELEKAQSEAQKAQAAKEKAEADAKAQLEAANKKLLDSEIKMTALAPVVDKDKKVTRPAFRKEAMQEVLLLINREAITEDDGTYKGVEKALSELAKAKPYLLEEKQEQRRGTPGGSGSGSGRRNDGERTPIISSL